MTFPDVEIDMSKKILYSSAPVNVQIKLIQFLSLPTVSPGKDKTFWSIIQKT